jgi:MFS family permease
MSTDPASRVDPTMAGARALARSRNAVFLIFALNGFGMATWIARTPAIRASLDISTGQMGLLIFGVSVGSILGLVLSTRILHWLGRSRTIAASLALAGASLALIGVGTGVVSDFAVAFAGMALYGLGTGLCDVAMNVEGAIVERAAGKSLMPMFHAFFSFGTVAGAGAGALAASAGVPVPVHLGVVGSGLVAGALLSVRALLPEAAGGSEVTADGMAPRAARASRMAIWLEPRTLLIGLIVLGMAFAEGSANDWLALAMVDEHGVSYAAGAALFGLFTVAMTIGRVVGGPVLDRFGRVPVLRGSTALAAVGLLLVVLPEFGAVTLVGIVLWGLGASLGFPIGMSAAADDPAKAAARVSAVATIGYLAFLAGPPLIGVLGETAGLLRALLVVVGLIVLAGSVAFAAAEGGRR